MQENNNNLNITWAQLIVEELIRCGVDHFCISPGSRSTPLVIAVARNRRARSIICYDERGAAFHALGYARASNRPAAVITTSGTAAANLYPAVTEASVDHVPMVLLTADRPPELTDTGANQTMNQKQFFGSHVRWHFDLPCPDENVGPEVVLTTVDQAVSRSSGSDCGPVHINCRYREPLVPDGKSMDDDYTSNIRLWMTGDDPLTTYSQPNLQINPDTLQKIATIINATNHGMLVVGKLTSNEQRQAVLTLADRLNWTVYADVTSGLRLTDCRTHIIRYFDQELLSDRFNEQVAPDVVLHIGGRITSKRVPQFFDANRPGDYIVIKDNPQRYDPIHAVTMHIQSDIAAASNALVENVPQHQPNDYSRFFSERAGLIDDVIVRNIDNNRALNEPFIAREISNVVPDNTCLFISSSMPIRDIDLYGVSGREGIKVGANRGISGIDGVIASASGFGAGAKSLTTLLIGDIAFIHDINSLSILRSLDHPVIIILVNNGGGGIFHFLPISEHQDVFEDYFATPHKFSFGGACETFGIDYFKAQTKQGFVELYQSAVSARRSAVIEVTTDRQSNLKLRRSIKNEIIDLLNNSV